MKVHVGVAVILSLGLAFAAQQSEKQPGQVSTIKASGCVEPGVESGCKVLRDTKTGDVYNLFFSPKSQPPLNAAISFEGTAHDGPTTCMQGKPVDVRSWTRVKMHCPAATEPNPHKK